MVSQPTAVRPQTGRWVLPGESPTVEDPRRLAAVEVGRENGLMAAGGPRREEGLMGAGTNLLLWRVNPGGG